MQQGRRGTFSTFGSSHTGLLSVIPFHPDGVTLPIGVHKCTYLSRNVTAVIRVLYLFEELRVYVWLRLSSSHNLYLSKYYVISDLRQYTYITYKHIHTLSTHQISYAYIGPIIKVCTQVICLNYPIGKRQLFCAVLFCGLPGPAIFFICVS